MTQILQRLIKMLYLLVVIVGAIAVASLVVLNDTPVQLNLPLSSAYEFSLGMIVVIAFVLGIITSIILTSFTGINTYLRLRSATKKLRAQESSE